jgi:hypothetical protein
MKNKLRNLLPLLALAFSANAGIVVFNDQAVPRAYMVDPATSAATIIAEGSTAAAWGAAYNPLTSTLYWNNGSKLMSAAGYTGGALSPTSTVTMTYGQSLFNVTGLAFDTVHTKLIGYRNIGTAGLYEIDVATGQATLLAEANGSFGGLDFDPTTGYLYATGDGGVGFGPGLYRIDDLYTTPVFTLIASYPDGHTDIDGLAAGDGMAYLILDEPAPIYAYDLVANSYSAPLVGPITGTGLFAAGAYIPGASFPDVPEPASMTAMAGLSLLLGFMLRKQRRARS